MNEKPPVKTYCGGKPNYCTPEEVHETPPCKTDPQAPHGFNRNASHNLSRYVCECEHWTPVDGVYMSQERVDETAKGEHEWVGLTTSEVIECQEASIYDTYINIEAKLKEKNVPQP